MHILYIKKVLKVFKYLINTDLVLLINYFNCILLFKIPEIVY